MRRQSKNRRLRREILIYFKGFDECVKRARFRTALPGLSLPVPTRGLWLRNERPQLATLPGDIAKATCQAIVRVPPNESSS